jgi:hypothetical protein
MEMYCAECGVWRHTVENTTRGARAAPSRRKLAEASAVGLGWAKPIIAITNYPIYTTQALSVFIPRTISARRA